MKDRLRVLPMKAVAAAGLLTGVLPVSILLGRYFAPETPLLWWLPPVLACLWGVAGWLAPKKWKIPFLLAGCILLLGLGMIFHVFDDLRNLALLLPCLAILVTLPPAWGRFQWDEWPAGAWMGGVVVHLAAYTLSTRPPFSGTGPYLTASFLVYGFLFTLMMNRHSIRDGMHGAAKAPAAIRRRNTALVTVMFLVAVGAACWGTLGRILDAVWQKIKLAIFYIFDFLSRLLPEQKVGQGVEGGGGGSFGGLEEAAEPSLFAIIMEKVAFVIAAAALLALVVLGAIAIYKGVIRLWKRLMAYLQRYAHDAGEDYIDEAESTLNWDERSQSIRDQLQKAFKRKEKTPRWEDMNGRDRVRWLYQQFLRRKTDARQKTAREALLSDPGYSRTQAQAFAQTYEKARYSTQEVTKEDADALRKTIKG